MQELTKIVARQDANFKLSPSTSNETSINLSNEISSLISDESGEVTFKLYKEDFVKAISALCLMPMVYKKKSTEPSSPYDIFSSLYDEIRVQFADSDTSYYTINILKRDDGRAYFNNLKALNGFNLRSFLVEQFSILHFIKDENGSLSIRLQALLPEEGIERKEVEPSCDRFESEDSPRQIIFYGAPGTGKSFEVNERTKGHSVIRTTFHPDSDYSTFVGAYKPIMEEQEARVLPVVLGTGASFDTNNGTYKEKRIVYKFVKQAFLKAYLGAWKKYAEDPDAAEPQFLVIEEINRGNCAQIFGDLFQLLDRENGFSKYPIEADDDLRREIDFAFNAEKTEEDNPGEYRLLNDLDIDAVIPDYESAYGATLSEDVKNGRVLLLPPNLYIWATMNTSDQSLFPIDSAFKRRWEWKYVKISNGYKKENGSFVKDASGNRIPLGWQIEGADYQLDWWEFVQAVNAHISTATSSDDKKLGYFFCKPKTSNSIDEETFAGKVLFYLWNDVFKDNDNRIFIVEDGQQEASFDVFYEEDEVTGLIKPKSANILKFLKNVMGEKGKSKIILTESPKAMTEDNSNIVETADDIESATE